MSLDAEFRCYETVSQSFKMRRLLASAYAKDFFQFQLQF